MNKYIPIGEKLFEGVLPDEESVVDSLEALTINLIADNDVRIVISFVYLCYRKIDEGDAFRMLGDYSKSGSAARLLYRVEDSEFMRWFKAENCEARDLQEIRHFCVCTQNSFIDVLAFEDPRVEIVK